MIKHGDWIDKIDRDIIPFVEYPGYENRYPTIEPIRLSNRLLQEVTDASRFLFYAFRDTTRVFQDCGNEFMKDMDIPEKLIPYLMNVMKDAASSLFPDAKDLVCFVSLYDLRIDDDGVVLPDGRHAGAIYRLHPMELLIEETAEDGTDLGVYMLEGYKHGKFAMMNPPEAIIMQSKGFQALITQKECKAVLSESQREAVEKYMLPTFFERDFVPEKESRWIKKPIWGREGNGIKLLDHHGNLIDEKYIENPEEIVQRDSTTCIYQKFIEQPTFKLKTDEGIVDGYITLSVFMLGKEPSAVYARFSPEQIAGTEAYWAPIIGTLE